MELLVSRGPVPKGFRVPDSTGAIDIPGCYAHVFVRALVEDGLVPWGDAAEVMSRLAGLERVTLELAASVLPSPWWEACEYLARFFWAGEPAYAFVPGLPNVSLVSLLSAALKGKRARYVFPWSPGLDQELLHAVDRLLAQHGSVLVAAVDRLDFQLASRADAIYVAPDADVGPLRAMKSLPVAIRDRVRPGVAVAPSRSSRAGWALREVEWLSLIHI